MNETTVRAPRPKEKIRWALHGARIGFLFLVVMAFTWCLAGLPGNRLRSWQEGRVAPYAVYAPFGFTYQEQDKPVEIQQGELVVSKGERITATHVARLTTLDQMQAAAQTRFHWWGALLLASLFTLIGSFYLRQYEPKIWETPSQQVLVAFIVGFVLLIARLILESPLPNAWIPVSSVTLLLGMLLNPRVGIIYGILATSLIGVLGQVDLSLSVSFGVGCFVGAFAIRKVRRRMDFFRAGLITGLAQALGLLGGDLFLHSPFQEAFLRSFAGLGSGILSSLITFCLLPLCEFLFRLVTDVTLLEISDLNHPLLKELSVKAPGTYHHSLIVANLAEAACEAIRANALLARVGCYFHDIGKMLHPEYFVENQPPKVSRHDRLQPSMSSLVILNHVKDGIELARKHRLNQAIIDFIPGHHGTGLIYYFYRRALEEVEDETLLKEERFRYPGPKPHSRETAVALLADSVEAATRAQQKKSPVRIQEVVRRIINNKFIDGQLNDCDLTLRDLDRIAEAFQRVLAGIYHNRIEYPKLPGEEPDIVQENERMG